MACLAAPMQVDTEPPDVRPPEAAPLTGAPAAPTGAARVAETSRVTGEPGGCRARPRRLWAGP
eukprot:2863458-Alexandrium_andersonii.AAC.1